jgi:hypothetical protein
VLLDAIPDFDTVTPCYFDFGTANDTDLSALPQCVIRFPFLSLIMVFHLWVRLVFYQNVYCKNTKKQKKQKGA